MCLSGKDTLDRRFLQTWLGFGSSSRGMCLTVAIGKKLSGSLGKERESHAHVLAKHFITHDCMLCQSIVSELLSDEEEEWLRYQEFPIVKGVLMEKFKSV